ncbi:MAG: PKD domain-containing protein [Bacteroidota bacterium]
MKNISKLKWMIYLALIIPVMIGCKKKTTEDVVIASFLSTPDATDFMTIHFNNSSSNAAGYSWDFGDNTAKSSEVNPVHKYGTVGIFTVKLTATSAGGATDTYSATVTISDPNAFLTMLVGDTAKTWKLLRSTTTGRYPLEVGPVDRSTIWWAVGLNNDELAKRPCMLNDEWTFYRNGTMKFNAEGDYWAEKDIFPTPDNICTSTDVMMGINGDCSAWNTGTHTFVLTPGATPTIQAVGKGAYIGFFKLGNDAEAKVPQDFVTYNIILLTDGPVDTLVIEGIYHSADPTFTGGYWRFVLMHYDDPTQEPPIPGNKPNAAFTTSVSGLVVTFNNTTTDATSYNWDFGDGTTSTEQNPVHTYSGGPYNIILSATNANGTTTASTMLFIPTTDLTESLLEGAAWHVYVSEKSVFCGSGLGQSNWWALPKSFLTGGSGVDDWTCMPDDEFIFSAAAKYEYKTMGSARNDGYFGSPNGCWSDAEIAASAKGAPFGSGVHSYALTPATATNRAILTLTNGATGAAFAGFYKGYNGVASGVKGGENNGADPANFGSATNTYEVMGYAFSGTKEYMFLSVDISAAHDGSASWSIIFER